MFRRTHSASLGADVLGRAEKSEGLLRTGGKKLRSGLLSVIYAIDAGLTIHEHFSLPMRMG